VPRRLDGCSVLVQSISPTDDIEAARAGQDVVVAFTQRWISVLSFHEGFFYIYDYPTRDSSDGTSIADSDFYWQGRAFVLEAYKGRLMHSEQDKVLDYLGVLRR